MSSCLYECMVSHTRLRPKRHQLKHGSFMFFLELNQLEQELSKLRLLGKPESRKLYRFVDSDYLPGSGETITERVKTLAAELSEQSGDPPINSSELSIIKVLTNVRIFEYIFNPISLFFCCDKNEKPLCVIAEVGNTFQEKKPYLLRPAGPHRFASRQIKHFYVSPFSKLDQFFRFNLSIRDEEILLTVCTEDSEGTVLSGSLRGLCLPLTDRNILKLTLRYPLVTLRTITLIHWHAFLLWSKNIPFFRKEQDMHLQTGILNPNLKNSHETYEAEVKRKQ